MRRRTSAIACSFSAGLDGLTRSQQGDVAEVLRVLKAAGRFSAFEASANDTLARMMTRLCHQGCSIVRDGVRTDYGRLITTDDSHYPWTGVKLTAAGEQLLLDDEAFKKAKQSEGDSDGIKTRP